MVTEAVLRLATLPRVLGYVPAKKRGPFVVVAGMEEDFMTMVLDRVVVGAIITF